MHRPNRHDHGTASLSIAESSPPRFYYGWVMLPIATLGMICTGPAQTFGISAFNPSFREAFQLSETALASAYMAGTLLAASTLSHFGSLADRWGIRRIMTGVVVLFGGACIGASQVTGLFTLFLAFFFMRMLGQGALGLLSGNTLAYWFDRRLGTVEGVRNFGMAGAIAGFPVLNLALISLLGWRQALAVLGLGVWLIMLPLLALAFRNRPEDVGQRIDGLSESQWRKQVRDNRLLGNESGLSLREARRTLAFWVFAGSAAYWAMVSTAIIFSLIPLMQDRGMGTDQAALFMAVFAGGLAMMHLVAGWLADRFPLQKLLAASMLTMAASLCMIIVMRSPWQALIAGGLMGMAQASLVAAVGPVWPRFFGRAHLGRIRGVSITIMVAATSIGPVLLGGSNDFLGGYQPMLLVFAVMALPLAVVALRTRPPKIPDPSRDGETEPVSEAMVPEEVH
ncbi:MAG: MFS transporter [Phycisphaeraceae bacterium]|nr:MFS transporter [Phycisphaeraceae bacterium]